MSTMQSCEVAASQDQNVKEVNTGIWLWSTVKLEQQSEIRSDCFSSITKQTELQNNLINTISQAASTKGVALLDAFSAGGSTASANLQNLVRNNITMSNIQKSYNMIKQSQSVSFENSGIVGFRQVDLTQGSKIFAAATLNELSKSGVFNKIESYLDQTASTEMKNPLDFLVDLVGGITSGITSSALMFIFFIILIISAPFILIALVGKALSGSSSQDQVIYVDDGGRSTQPQPETMGNEAQDEVADAQSSEQVMPLPAASTPTTPPPPVATPKPNQAEQITNAIGNVASVVSALNTKNNDNARA